MRCCDARQPARRVRYAAHRVPIILTVSPAKGKAMPLFARFVSFLSFFLFSFSLLRCPIYSVAFWRYILEQTDDYDAYHVRIVEHARAVADITTSFHPSSVSQRAKAVAFPARYDARFPSVTISVRVIARHLSASRCIAPSALPP